MDLDAEITVDNLATLVQDVQNNFHDVLKQFNDIKQLSEMGENVPAVDHVYPKDTVTVSDQDLDRVIKEVSQLRENIQKVFTPELLTMPQVLESTEQDLEQEKEKSEENAIEREHWKSRYDAALSEVDKLKEEKLGLQLELQSAVEQLSQQVEFGSCMGAACGTLLWRVSRCEESVQTILVGTKVDEFLAVVSSTLESYVMTYKLDVPQETEDETQFVLSLCGIITNIAASPFGREFLMRNDSGRHLLETFINVLREAPNIHCAKMKNLILMALYNLSINQKGLKVITSQPGIMPLLTWIIQEETVTENRMHALRLIQSILYEQQSPEFLGEASEVLTTKLLQQLGADSCREIRETAIELGTDLQSQLDQLHATFTELNTQQAFCEP